MPFDPADGPIGNLVGRIILRNLRSAVWVLFCVVLLTGATVWISGLDTGGRSTVYAGDSTLDEQTGNRQFQAGLMGVVNGVADMERYSDSARMLSVVNGNEDVLAGFEKVDRRVLCRMAIGEGTKTAAALGYYAQQTVYENQMSSDEYYTLLKIVEAEATGGDLTSKMMVAGVVLNRVEDSHFPDTISEVVCQKQQFQPVSDGRFYSVTVTDETIEAVDRVLQGDNPAEGALFFFARDSAESQNVNWFDSSLMKIFEYGGHEYFTFKDYMDVA